MKSNEHTAFREIREKCTKSGRTVTKWGLESVESCEKVNSNPPTVHITFNTIRKNCRERTYIMEFSDAQELLKKVRAFLEARSLSAMNQVAYRCMKCSSMFSIETQPTVLSTLAVVDNEISEKKPSTKCPTCGSTLVVEMEEAPLPSSDKENDSSQSLSLPVSDQEKESQPSTSREETESSLALLLPATADSSASATPLKHSPSECSIGSAASLEQRMEVEPQSEATKEGTPTLRKYDSDIEVISNPSQSSIEVLEVQASIIVIGTTVTEGRIIWWFNEKCWKCGLRLQGNPARKRSSEERSTVAVPPQLNTVHEVQNMVNLTESSSSGSLTDSVCTAYENNPIPAKRVGMSDVPEESTPTPSSTYTSLLEGLIQSVTAKLTPRNSPSVDSTFAKVQYSYTDFSKVDHRIKLHLCQNTFKDDNEELSFFVRGNIVVRPRESFPGCLVVSTHAIYILQIVGPEFGENASEWFEQKVCHHCSDLSTIFMLPWQLGFGLRLGSLDYLVLLGDPVFSCNFIKFLKHNLDKGENIPQYTLVEEPSTQPERLLEQMITSSVPNNDGPVDSSVRYLALCSSASTAKDKARSAWKFGDVVNEVSGQHTDRDWFLAILPHLLSSKLSVKSPINTSSLWDHDWLRPLILDGPLRWRMLTMLWMLSVITNKQYGFREEKLTDASVDLTKLISEYGFLAWGGVFSITLEPLDVTQSTIMNITLKENRRYPTRITGFRVAAYQLNGRRDSAVTLSTRPLDFDLCLRMGREEVLKLSILPLLVTTTDLLLIQPQFSWLSPNAEPAKPVCAAHQKLANIIDVDVSGPELKIHYLIEAENQEEVWTLVFSSTDVVNTVLESIRGPWEQLFSVPLLSSEKH
ncbi:protein kinase binding [Homalodisca vitripennis]|nr:protein kinase binding [Homalodisca vitripennis]